MNKTNAWLILRGVLFAAAGATVAYLGHASTDGDTLGTYGPLVASVCTILTDVLHTLAKQYGPTDAPKRDGVEGEDYQ